jgi:hypothetical protein
VQAPHQPSYGLRLSTTELTPSWRPRPHVTPRAHLDEPVYAEAGPSTLVPLCDSPLAPPTTNPTGGTSEETADAENDQTITEENTAPVSGFYCSHISHVTEWSFGARRPDVPAALEISVAGASSTRKTCAGCVSGQEDGWTSQNAQAKKRLLKVSNIWFCKMAHVDLTG